MSALDKIFDLGVDGRGNLDWAIVDAYVYGSTKTSERAAEELVELRRLVALLTTEPLHITRADIDAAKRILQKAEE